MLISVLLLSPAFSSEPELQIGKFSSADLSGWKDQTIFGSKKTTYAFVKENGRSSLQAKSVNSASGLIHKIDIDPKTHPIIAWSWKIDHTVRKGNERIKDGHDFAARLYIVFKSSIFARTRAIEYVWGNIMSRGEIITNPYSKQVVMIAVNTGDELAGKWVSHKRNFADDYRKVFGEEPPRVRAIAIMTDSDNTHESATCYYGDISVLSVTKEPEQKPREKNIREQTHNGRTVTEPPAPQTPQ